MKSTILKFTAGALLLLAFSGCRVQEDTGIWRGAAINRDGYRESFSCSQEVQITHTDERVTLHHSSTDCGVYTARWQAGSFDVRGTTLWRNGRAGGWARADGSVTLDIHEPAGFLDERYPFPADRLVISWRQVGDTLEYSEEAYFAGKVQRTSGWLRRQ